MVDPDAGLIIVDIARRKILISWTANHKKNVAVLEMRQRVIGILGPVN
jgi:hypothetical protein